MKSLFSQPRLAAFLSGPLVCFLLSACGPGRHTPPPLTAYIPQGTDAIAYADVDRLRGTSLYSKLPGPEPLQGASAVMAILEGKDWAIAAGGDFRQAPAGATLIGPNIAAAGAPDLVRAMQAKPEGGAELLAHAPSDAPVWLVARGRATLPVSGNLGNFNRLLHQAEYTAIALRLSNQLEIDANSQCASAVQAQHLEENIRALASLARFQALAVSRDGAMVHVKAAVPLASVPTLR